MTFKELINKEVAPKHQSEVYEVLMTLPSSSYSREELVEQAILIVEKKHAWYNQMPKKSQWSRTLKSLGRLASIYRRLNH